MNHHYHLSRPLSLAQGSEGHQAKERIILAKLTFAHMAFLVANSVEATLVA